MNNNDEFSKAKYSAFNYLSGRALTGEELRQKLLKKEYSPRIIQKTMDFLIDYGYINDTDYVERYTKDALNFKKHGIARIRLDLRRKGIDSEIIDGVITSLDIDNSDTLQHLIVQKCQRLDISDPKQKNRLIGFLLRRGYRYDEIYSALREKLEDCEID